MQGSGKDGRITVEDARRALGAGRQARLILRDGTEGGLYLRAGGRGAVWWVEYKPPGRRPDGSRHPTRHLRLGSVQALSPDDARQRAAKAKHAVLDGCDPVEERRIAQARAVAPGWAQVKADYLKHMERRLPNARSRQNEDTYLAHLFEARDGAAPRLDPDAPLRSLDLAAVHRLLDALPAEGTIARQVLGALGRLLDWAIGRGLVDVANPVRLLPRGARPKKAAPRMRTLSPSEIGSLWKGAGKLAALECNLLRMMLAVPLRKSEIAAIEWSWIDRKGGTITLPDRIMKNGQAHAIPLGDLGRRVLDAIADGREWPTEGRVFVSDNKRTVDWARFKGRVDRAAPLPAEWTFHDFRRSFVSALAEAGHDEAVLDAMLAHRASATRSGVLGVYQTARKLPAQRAAMAAWDRLIDGQIGEGGGKVVPLRA